MYRKSWLAVWWPLICITCGMLRPLSNSREIASCLRSWKVRLAISARLRSLSHACRKALSVIGNTRLFLGSILFRICKTLSFKGTQRELPFFVSGNSALDLKNLYAPTQVLGFHHGAYMFRSQYLWLEQDTKPCFLYLHRSVYHIPLVWACVLWEGCFWESGSMLKSCLLAPNPIQFEPCSTLYGAKPNRIGMLYSHLSAAYLWMLQSGGAVLHLI